MKCKIKFSFTKNYIFIECKIKFNFTRNYIFSKVKFITDKLQLEDYEKNHPLDICFHK